MDKDSKKHSSLVVSYTHLKYIPASVGYCLFVQWFSRTSKKIGNQLHTFFFMINATHGVGAGVLFLMKTFTNSEKSFSLKKQNYKSPEVEILKVNIEKGFAQSNPLEGGKDGGEYPW